MEYKYLSSEDVDPFLKTLSGKDRLTVKFYWKTASRRKELMVIRPLARFTGLYLIPPRKWEEAKHQPRYHRAALFSLKILQKTYVFAPNFSLGSEEPKEQSINIIQPEVVVPVPTPKRKPGRPKRDLKV
mgnify:CR=1 FL=1